MAFHWGLEPSQINQVVAVSGSSSAPTTASLLAAAKVEKKASKASMKAKPAKDKTASTRRVVGFELVFTSSVTGAQLTVRVPAAGAFHDANQRTALSDVEGLGRQIAKALNKGLHEQGAGRKKSKT